MKCPFCKSKLKDGLLKKYETLADHVINPNQEDYPERPTFICSCTPEVFWDICGDCYGFPKNRKWQNAILD